MMEISTFVLEERREWHEEKRDIFENGSGWDQVVSGMHLTLMDGKWRVRVEATVARAYTPVNLQPFYSPQNLALAQGDTRLRLRRIWASSHEHVLHLFTSPILYQSCNWTICSRRSRASEWCQNLVLDNRAPLIAAIGTFVDVSRGWLHERLSRQNMLLLNNVLMSKVSTRTSQEIAPTASDSYKVFLNCKILMCFQ